MGFFKVPRSTPFDEALPEPKPWFGPPMRTLPGRLADTVLLVHNDRVAIAVSSLAAYPTGFTFALETVPRRNDPHEWADLDHHGLAHRVRANGASELPPELLRFGVEFADGTRATSLDMLDRSHRDPDTAPDVPLLLPRGGGGGGGRWTHSAWVWPLPPAGRLTFVCEWPALDIPLTRQDVDADLVRAAAGRAVTFWDDAGEQDAHTPRE